MESVSKSREDEELILKEHLQEKFPLHWLVWHNEHLLLADLLQDKRDIDIEQIDGRGRTALMLAVTLGHLTSARVLLTYGADANCENSDGWTVAQEAVARGDPDLLQLVLQRREVQRQRTRASGIPRLLQQLRDAPDFYVEMRWEFASWVPLVSRLCPSDTYRVYKRGANVRVDTTLLGFEQNMAGAGVGGWQRGSRSYMFRGGSEGDPTGPTATLLEVDHDARQVIVEEMLDDSSNAVSAVGLDYIVDGASNAEMGRRLGAPIVATYVDTDNIAFERTRNGGLMGALWKSSNGAERTESVAGHDCRVFAATNVQLITKTRTEHLRNTNSATTAAPPVNANSNANTVVTTGPFHSLLSGGTSTAATQREPRVENAESDEPQLTAIEYFSTQHGDIGLRPKRVETRVQKFKATLWLAENYPLSLPEQVLPIVDLMATSSPHFAKLRDFIRLQLPAGFPVKIEIPLFHVLNARITFGNIFGKEESVEGVSVLLEDEEHNDGQRRRLTCVVDDSAFDPPSSYTVIGGAGAADVMPPGGRTTAVLEEHDELLQFAIEQSLLDGLGGQEGADNEEVDIWEALRYDNDKPSTGVGVVSSRQRHLISEEERQLQRAIQASLSIEHVSNSVNPTEGLSGAIAVQEHEHPPRQDIEDDLLKALRLSEEERLREVERQQQEQRQLDEILQLSLTEM